MEGIGNSEEVGGGGGGGIGQENSRVYAGWMIKITFQWVNFELSTKIATYCSGRSFLKT